MRNVIAITLASLGCAAAALSAQDRGTRAMGFDQQRTAHRFVLRPDGGEIRVDVKSTHDRANTSAIRAHLRQIAVDFAAGRFDAPLATHGEEPPGVETLRARAAAIRYRFEETRAGGVVTIRSSDPAAVAAVHDFLRYQIREHRTGDPIAVHAHD